MSNSVIPAQTPVFESQEEGGVVYETVPNPCGLGSIYRPVQKKPAFVWLDKFEDLVKKIRGELKSKRPDSCIIEIQQLRLVNLASDLNEIIDLYKGDLHR